MRDTRSGYAITLAVAFVIAACPIARADDAADISSQIEDLQNDIENHQNAADNWDEEAQKLADTSNCSGPSAPLCVGIAQIGVAKARSNANQEREAIREDQAKIRRLQAQLTAGQ